MKKNGFISVSIVYSFFFVFLLLLLFIVNNLVSNRTMLNVVKKQIKSELSDNFVDHLKSTYHSKEDNGGLYLHDGSTTTTIDDKTDIIDANDYSYRYFGANPNNYLYFGCEDSCTVDNLYRIIGIFDGKVKIIKNQTVSLKYNDSLEIITIPETGEEIMPNDFSNSTLYTYLNGAFLEIPSDVEFLNISSNYWYLIETFNWQKASLTSNNLNSSAYEIFNIENNSGDAISAAIGLPQVSDYIYASTSDTWTNPLSSFTGTNNWLYQNNMWFITKNTSYNYEAFSISEGSIKNNLVNEDKNVTPTLYLKGNVRYKSGDGTIDNPYMVG